MPCHSSKAMNTATKRTPKHESHKTLERIYTWCRPSSSSVRLSLHFFFVVVGSCVLLPQITRYCNRFIKGNHTKNMQDREKKKKELWRLRLVDDLSNCFTRETSANERIRKDTIAQLNNEIYTNSREKKTIRKNFQVSLFDD